MIKLTSSCGAGALKVILEDKNPRQKSGKAIDRSIRHPTTKQIIRIPLSKPHLATGLALEWDLLRSIADVTKSHLIPLTSLTCRALDTLEEEAHNGTSIRDSIMKTVMRYLETDTLLCWAPERDPNDPSRLDDSEPSLRDTQREAAEAVVGYLTMNVWPGIEFVPVLDGHSIFPNRQREETLAVVKGWVAGMSAWELVGLERAVLATKSFLLGARLLTEWSEGPVGIGNRGEDCEKVFGIEEAARLASLEVNWQTGRWGEVEDTHDVDREDVRRQLGGVVLLVSGTGR
jgi:ATP synthase F1 complex assembly factor 2